MYKRKLIVVLFLLLSVSVFAQKTSIDFYTSGGQFAKASSDFSTDTEYYSIHIDDSGLITGIDYAKDGIKTHSINLLTVKKENNLYSFEYTDWFSRYIKTSIRVEKETVYIRENKNVDGKSVMRERTIKFSTNPEKKSVSWSEDSSFFYAIIGKSFKYKHKVGEYEQEELFTGKVFSVQQDIASYTEYSRDKSGMIISQNYWNYDVVSSGGKFYEGPRTGYDGPSLYRGNLNNSLLNFLILEQIFHSNTPYYFGYALFDINVP